MLILWRGQLCVSITPYIVGDSHDTSVNMIVPLPSHHILWNYCHNADTQMASSQYEPSCVFLGHQIKLNIVSIYYKYLVSPHLCWFHNSCGWCRYVFSKQRHCTTHIETVHARLIIPANNVNKYFVEALLNINKIVSVLIVKVISQQKGI